MSEGLVSGTVAEEIPISPGRRTGLPKTDFSSEQPISAFTVAGMPSRTRGKFSIQLSGFSQALTTYFNRRRKRSFNPFAAR